MLELTCCGCAGASIEAACMGRAQPMPRPVTHTCPAHVSATPPPPPPPPPPTASLAPQQDVLKSIIGTALEVSKLQQFTGRDKPTVIT